MKAIAAILLLSSCALAQNKSAISAPEAGCGPQDQKFEVNSDPSQHPAPTPEEGKAVIYFMADGHPTSVFGVDGKWVGAVNGGRYFFVSIEPGEHHLCARRQNSVPPGARTGFHDTGPRVSVHSLKAEPGGSYYFRTRMLQIVDRPGGMGFVFQLDQMDPDEGRWFVSSSEFSTSHSKD